HRGATTATEDRGGVDRRLDPFAPRESYRKEEERVGVEQAEALREAEAGRSEAKDVADIDAVRDDLDVVPREAGELRELLRTLLRHRDVSHARHRAGDEAPPSAIPTPGRAT